MRFETSHHQPLHPILELRLNPVRLQCGKCRRLFPDPQAMMREVQRTNRKVVTIVDPHVKREDGYWIHKEASSKGYYVKSSDGKSEYKGHCWPGEVSYLDVTRKDVREWFQSQLSPKKYNGRCGSEEKDFGSKFDILMNYLATLFSLLLLHTVSQMCISSGTT